MKRFALAGNPNCGKTTLFNNLTGSTAHVGNWPGVTVDKREGLYKKLEEQIAIVDLPGIYSLSPYTPEEVISRNYILDEKPDCVINIVDATNLERNLYLTTQLLEIDVPVIVALNMIDEVKKAGDKIDAATLEHKIGVPVVAISALKGDGVEKLMKRAYECSKNPRKGTTVLEGGALMHLIRDCKIALEGAGVENALFHAVKLVELDEIEIAQHPQAAETVQKFKETFDDETFGSDFEAIVADSRYRYISQNYSKALVRGRKSGKDKLTASDKADRILTHRIWGIPIFLAILFAVFHLTFSEDFLYLGAMGALGKDWVSLQGMWGEGIFGSAEGIASPGVILFNLLDCITSSISGAVSDAMTSGGVAQWATGFVVDGMLGGLFSVMSFLPQILLLFLFFSLLEDSGYMARVAFILDRLFRKFGLSGRAFMPMIMGFGCSVPAMVNTRTLADENERVATIRVIPFFSCGAKLPILTAVAGGIAQLTGTGNADLITYSMYLLGITVAICAVLLMRSTTMRGDVPPFIMELPSYRMPQAHSLAMLLWDKVKHFIKKAFTIILASTIVIWFVSHFSFSWEFLTDDRINESILAGVGMLVQPLLTPLGFGSQLGEWGWVFVVAAVTGLIAKENVIATFGTLAACISSGFVADEALGGVDSVAQMISATGIGVPALIAFIAFNMLTIPCFAAVATAKAEMPNKKKFNFTLLFWIATSYVVSSMIYLIGEWWWTAFIWAAVWVTVIVMVVLYNKGILNFGNMKKIFEKKRKA